MDLKNKILQNKKQSNNFKFMTWGSLKIPLYSYPENDKDVTEKMYSVIHKIYPLFLSIYFVQNLFHSNQYVASYTASAPGNARKPYVKCSLFSHFNQI
jgi:hypothetical protein